MTLILKITSDKSACQYIMLQDFAVNQVLEFALTSSSCYNIKKQGVILLIYCRSLKTTPQKNWKNTISQKKMDMMVFFQ